MSSFTLVFPSGIRSVRGPKAAKSSPGFADPDSVHQVNVTSPRGLPVRRTGTLATCSTGEASMTSAANAIRVGNLLLAGTGGDSTADAATGGDAEGRTVAGGAAALALAPIRLGLGAA